MHDTYKWNEKELVGERVQKESWARQNNTMRIEQTEHSTNNSDVAQNPNKVVSVQDKF